MAFAVEEGNRRSAKWMCPYKYMGGYEAKSPTFFQKRPRKFGKSPTFFELSPSEDFEEGMFSKKDEYYLVGKPYFCSSRGGANGDFGSVLTRES